MTISTSFLKLLALALAIGILLICFNLKTLLPDVSRQTSPSFPAPSSMSIMHDSDDDELMWKARSMAKSMKNESRVLLPKVAFLFMAREDLPLAPFWEEFFKGNEGFYSIYVHSHPSFIGSEPDGSVFHERRIPSKVVQWGDLSMMKAELRLLANALLDPANQRFVLLSESCIPLYNFPTIYSYLINSTKIYVETIDNPGSGGRGRYIIAMRPHLELRQWRKGSQWFELDRDIASELIADDEYFPLFEKYCTGLCLADEHYIPTFVSVSFGRRAANRSLTWADWSNGGAHPARLGRAEVTVEFLKRLREASSCSYNGAETKVCFLFARKFLPKALKRLMRFGPKFMRFGSKIGGAPTTLHSIQ